MLGAAAILLSTHQIFIHDTSILVAQDENCALQMTNKMFQEQGKSANASTLQVNRETKHKFGTK